MMARNKCKKAEDTSDLNSESDTLKKRNKRQRLNSSSEEESSINSFNDMFTPPRIQGLFKHCQLHNKLIICFCPNFTINFKF